MPQQKEQAQHRNLQETLNQIQALLQKQAVVNTLVNKQDMPRHALVQSLVERQQSTSLTQKLKHLHPADIAFVLENIPAEQRQELWKLISSQQRGGVLLELSESVCSQLIALMDEHELVRAAGTLPSDEIADLVPNLPKDIVPRLLDSLAHKNREQVKEALNFPDDSVGALMDFDFIKFRLDACLADVMQMLQRRGSLPAQMHQIFIVDSNNELQGSLPLQQLLIHPPETPIAEVLNREALWFYTTDSGEEAVQAFERYDLFSAPVVNVHKQLVGRLAVDAVMDFSRSLSQKDLLNQVGLREEENLFAPVWRSCKNRWPWLGVNLMTAFVASNVISLFEETIAKLAALAVLMPIVASIGGNTGNQTIALVIRGLSLNQITRANFLHLLRKEISIALLNGLIWGAVVGVFAFVLYQSLTLSLVMLCAMAMNLFLASTAGVIIPLVLKKLGRDPVMGSSIFLTALTDSLGFFIFLGLAQLFLT